MIEQRPETERREAPYDPLRFCIFTTIALLAWALGAPVAVMLMAGLGIAAYVSAYRRGLNRSKCFLRDTRLVIAYLGLAFLGGATVTTIRLLDSFR